MLLYHDGGSAALQEILWTNSVGRFSGSFSEAGHFEPFYYYLVRLPQAFLPWNILLYLGLWHLRKRLARDRYLLFFCLWLAAQFALLSFASSKRMVYLMALAPAAAVIAAEFGHVLLTRWHARASQWMRRAAVSLALLVPACYLGYAIWVEPRADLKESFLPLTAQIRQYQMLGRQVALYQPSERLAGAGVFYSRSLLPALQTSEELTTFLGQPDQHIALLESQTVPQAPLSVLQHFRVGERDYYFVGQQSSR